MFASASHAQELPASPTQIPTPSTSSPEPASQPIVINGASATDDFQQRVTKFISAKDPIYFALGTRGDTNVKFQLSFKYQLSSPSDGEPTEFYHRLYFGYTQTSFWDLQAESKPFEDSIYRPSLFYYDDNIYTSHNNLRGYGIESGLEHQSNGQSGALSRSLNIAYVRPTIRLGDPLDWHWTIAPKAFIYIDKEENPDIQDYRGYVDLLIKYGKPSSWEFSALLRKGTGAKGSADLVASYPLRHVPFSNINGYLFAEYFDGYGENLRDYNLRLESQFRIGLMIVR